MKKVTTRVALATLFFGSCLLVGLTPAKAASVIPYPNVGTVNPASYTFTATSTGDIVGYFYSFSAADTDEIAMSLDGGATITSAGYGLVNQTSTPGVTSFNFGEVTAGQTLTFILYNENTGSYISSNASSNADSDQHVYSQPYLTGQTYSVAEIPDGTFVAFEDLLASQNSDFDYNDDAFVFTDLSIETGTQSTTPLPATLPLFASGLGALGLLGWRRKRKAQATA